MRATRRRVPRSVRAFRALLALYPGEFRDEYGRELAMVFADRYRDAPDAWSRALVWIEAITGVLREAPKEHARMLLKDLRYAARLARRRPGFTVTALLTLALGIGANTAIFQLIDAVRLRTLPIRNPGELAEVRVAAGNPQAFLSEGAYSQLTRPMWEELRRQQEAFSSAFAWSAFEVTAGEGADARRVPGLVVSGEFFQTLGITPWRGRLFDRTDETACPSSRAIVSHAFWQRTLGGRDAIVGERITVNGERHEIVGVTPPEFFGVAVGESFDLAFPFCQSTTLRRDVFNVAVMGRLRPGWTIARATAHLNALSARLVDATAPTGYSQESIDRFKQFRLAAYPAGTGVSSLRTEYDRSLTLLLAITGLVLLLACANLANLMLARAMAREREVSVRLALGASRAALLRQFLVESALLAAAGAALGVGLAQWFSRALVWALASEEWTPTLAVATSWRVLLFSAAVAVATCAIFGVLPALRAARIQPAAAMQSGGRSMSTGREGSIAQRVMVSTQVAVSLVLLVAALLFVRSFYTLMTFDGGIRQEGISAGYFDFPAETIPVERRNEVRRSLLEEVRSVPGVTSAATTSHVPLMGGAFSHGFSIGGADGWSRFTWVSPDYFEMLGIRVIEGRTFTAADTETSTRVAVVNETFVRQYVPDGRAIGRTVRTSPEPDYPSAVYEIVGVVADTRYGSLRGDVDAIAFAAHTQIPPAHSWTGMMIRSSIDPGAAILSVKRRLAATHPDVPADLFMLQARVRGRLVKERLLAMLAGFFGVLAAALAAVGLYGTISFAASQRRQEIGIRIALGAQRSQVLRLVMREAAWPIAAGLAAGVSLSLIAGRSAAALLFGVAPHDPVTLASAGALLTSIAIAATFVPARTASRLDPLDALRQE